MPKPELQPFNPNDPYNRVADRLRKDVAGLAQKSMATVDYQRLTPTERIEATAAGLVTGTLGVLFAHIEDDGRDAIVQWLIEYLPQARLQVEGIIQDGMKTRN